jgi:hypothetical protein
VGAIKDARTGAAADLAFVVSDSPIGSIVLKSGISGYDINGEMIAEIVLPDDIDGDGNMDDAVALYSTSYIGKVQTARGINGDVVVEGTNATGFSLSSLVTKAGGFHGDMVLDGNAGKIQLGGDFGSSLQVGGNVLGVVQDSATSPLWLSGANSAFTNGLTVRKGNVVYDVSIKGQLLRLQDLISER